MPEQPSRSTYSATFFLTGSAHSRGSGAPNPVLYVSPDGGPSGYISLQISEDIPLTERLKIADALLRGAQQFRDAVAADAERKRTVEDELAEARAEIARLKGEAGEVE